MLIYALHVTVDPLPRYARFLMLISLLSCSMPKGPLADRGAVGPLPRDARFLRSIEWLRCTAPKGPLERPVTVGLLPRDNP